MIPVPGGALAWFVGLLLAVGVGGYIKGCSDERDRFERFKAQVEAVAEAQRQQTLNRIAEARLRAKEAEDAHRKELDRLRARARDAERRMRDAIAGSSPVPTVPGAAEGGAGTICFDREALDRGIRGALARFLEGATGIVAQGDEAREAFRACAEWAMREYAAGR